MADDYVAPLKVITAICKIVNRLACPNSSQAMGDVIANIAKKVVAETLLDILEHQVEALSSGMDGVQVVWEKADCQTYAADAQLLEALALSRWGSLLPSVPKWPIKLGLCTTTCTSSPLSNEGTQRRPTPHPGRGPVQPGETPRAGPGLGPPPSPPSPGGHHERSPRCCPRVLLRLRGRSSPTPMATRSFGTHREEHRHLHEPLLPL